MYHSLSELILLDFVFVVIEHLRLGIYSLNGMSFKDGQNQIPCYPLGLDGEAQLMGILIRIEQLPRDFPWSLQIKT